MSTILGLVVPWGLLAVFLYRARKARIFLLGIPFLMFMGESVFFDRMKVFHTPGRLDPYVLLLIWMLIVWAATTGRIALPGGGPSTPPMRSRRTVRFLPEELAVLAIGAISLGHVVVEAVRSADFVGAFERGFGMLTMVLGYYLVRDIVSHATRREVISFLSMVVVANAIATTLFIIHQALPVDIYPRIESSVVIEGQVITRTLYFAPRFIVLTLAFVFARRRWGGVWAIVLLTTLLGIMLSFTRTLLLVAIVALLLAVGAREIKTPSTGRLLRRAVAIAAFGMLLLWGFVTFLPAPAHYFEQRLAGLSGDAAIASDSSFVVRTEFLAATVDIVRRRDLAFGLGFPLASQEASVANVTVWGADMAWILVVYRLGLAGVLAFAVVYVGHAIRAFLLFMRDPDEGEYLGLVYFVAIVAGLTYTGVSRTFMEPNLLPMGLWLFAFVAAEARRRRPEAMLPSLGASSSSA